MARTDGRVGPREYQYVVEEGFFHGLGEWVFTGVLHDDPAFGRDTFVQYAAEEDLPTGMIHRMREHAADFVELAVAEILDCSPSVVGFTSTFMQNVPSLATAKRIKEVAPDVAIVFGGGNCDGEMGVALHRNYEFVDFVVRGEGEVAFPALLRAIVGDGTVADVPGLCWRDEAGEPHHNTQGNAIPAERLPVPDFDDWFDRLDRSPVNEYVEPRLVMETARGCWWGEKHHCTFCGLNGTLMQFRAKSSDAVVSELAELTRRHQVLDVIMVDNIIDNGYFTTVLPRIADLDWDLRLHYEVKANLKPSDIRALRMAGVIQVQPGMESLVSTVLGIMDKGVSAVHNVRTLRDCESAGLSVAWNWLYGFPGESPGMYADVVRQLPALVHLQPPLAVSRICLERFSPYFDNPALGFPERTTARSYRHIYALDEAVLRDMVYLFDTPPAGLSKEDAKPLREFADLWAERYRDSTLRVFDDGGEMVIVDRRVGWPPSEYRIDEPRWRATYLEIEHGRTPTGLLRAVRDRGFDELTEFELRTWLAELRERGLVFEESGRFIALATSSDPIKLG